MDSPYGAAVSAEDFGLKGPRGWAFRSVSFDAGPGSLIAIEGPSGSGRTCLLLALTGRMRPAEGRVEVAGLPLPRKMAAVRGISALGPVPGVSELDPALTVAEHLRERALLQRRFDSSVRALLRPRGERAAEARGRVEESLERAGLDLATLPKGERTAVRDLERLEALRFSVALALIGRPRLIAVDDTDLKLSDGDRAAAWRLLRAVAGAGPTVLAVCSDAPGDATVIRMTEGPADGRAGTTGDDTHDDTGDDSAAQGRPDGATDDPADSASDDSAEDPAGETTGDDMHDTTTTGEGTADAIAGLAALELKRFGRGKLPRAAMVAIVLLPLLYGALYLWSFWDPYSQLDRIPVALVNEDKGSTAAGQKIAAGDDITRGLRESEVFEWHEVSAAEAREGVEDGAYYLSLTMPSDLSARIASSSGGSPETGALQVRTNDANNYIVGQISRTVFSEVRTAASTKASRSFLDRIFISFSDIHEATEKAAQGAEQLKSGVGKAKKGSQDLSDGLKEAKSGSGRLAGGLAKLTKGAGDLESGSRQVAAGTQQLTDKVNGIATDVRPYLKDNGESIGAAAKLVAGSSQAIRHNLDILVKSAPASAALAHTSADELSALHKARCEDVPLPDATVCPALKRAKVTAADVARSADDINALVTDNNGDLKKLDAHLAGLQKKANALAARSPRLDEDLESTVTKINDLNSGARKVAAGADRLHTGLGGAKSGSTALDSGVGRLKKGAGELDGGLFKLTDGSTELAGGLNAGVDKIPDYDKKDRDRRTGVMADPVKLARQSLHKAPNYGTGFAPYFIPLSLWVGAMVAYMIIQPLNRRALAVGASAWRIAVAGWLPVVAIGLVQVVALMSVLHWGLGLKMAHAAGTVAFLSLVICCFAAIIQWLNARFGAAGRILVLAVLMLQLTSAGGTYPVQTSPGFFNAIHPFLPMTYVVDALRRLITGGGLGSVWEACAVLAAFTAGALALTAVAARRKQVWTLDRLHPELTL